MDWEQHNSEQQTKFTSTGSKLLMHPDVLSDLRSGHNHPIVLHIMPTERCNLKCVFCSVAERENYPDLSIGQICYVVEALLARGLKAVILSGGGEPLLYPKATDLLRYLCGRVEVGLITNGTLLNKMNEVLLSRLSWIRISANSYDYVDDIDLPQISGGTVIGFSYIFNEKSTQKTLDKITRIAKERNVKYIRLLPDCNLPTDGLEVMHKYLHYKAEQLGSPWFHQYKTHQTLVECHLGRVHPVLYTSGEIFPCDSVVLNKYNGEKRFDSRYALCRWDQVGEFFDKSISGSLVDTTKCPHCVFAKQNEILYDVIHSVSIPEPVICQMEHSNFV